MGREATVMQTRLAGRRALVVGGSRGIGRAIALRFAAEGADVAVAALDDAYLERAEAAIRATGRRGLGIPGDVARLDDCVRIVDRAMAFLGGLDILVNNVGVATASGPLHTIAPEAWDQAFALNVRAAAVCSARAIPTMLAQGKGAILHTTSTRGLTGRRNYSPYATTKAALNQLTRCMALDYADQGIRVNAIAPGAIAVESYAEVLHALDDPAYAERFLVTAGPEERAWYEELRRDPVTRRDLAVGNAPMGRRGTPDEVAAAAAFLVSDEASYITGHILVVDGGRTAGP